MSGECEIVQLMETSQKGFIAPLLLALIAILLIGGGTYVYMQKKQVSQPVAEQTSGWKTYTNTQYGFEVKYPSVGEVIVDTHMAGGIPNPGVVRLAIRAESLTDNPNPVPGNGYYIFSIASTQYKDNRSLLFAKENEVINNPNVGNIWKVTETNFLNMGKAIIVSENKNSLQHSNGCARPSTISESVFIVKAPYLFTFDDYSCDTNYVYNGLMAGVIGTFKFIPTIAPSAKSI